MHRTLVAATATAMIAALGLGIGSADAPAAKQAAKCAKGKEKLGCTLPQGAAYRFGKLGGILVGRSSFTFDDIVANATCADGSKVRFIYDTGNASGATGKRAKIGQTQRYDQTANYVSESDDEIPTRITGSITFTSAKKAKLKATVSAKYPTDSGISKDCSGTVNLTLNRVKTD